eukprot:2644418-Lingulodinium_polyedra.AAC.1
MRHLSDHALVTAHPNARASYRTRPCTPSAIKTLPPVALEDLRRVFTAFEVTLQVPDPGPVVPKQLVRLPEPAGELEHTDALME